MMNKQFANPYIVYYPVVSRDGMLFSVNRTIRGMQEEASRGRSLREDQLWRGNQSLRCLSLSVSKTRMDQR